MSRPIPPQRPAPIQFGADPTIWATWLYYAENRTQAEVANVLGVSRASVANYLAEARRRGLVSINVAPDLLGRIRMCQALIERFALQDASIAPAMPEEAGDPMALRRRLGAAGAAALAPLLGEDTVLGVAWGRTMAALAAALPQRRAAGLRVVQVSGSSLGDEETSPESCTLQIASRLGARCHHFHAPAVVSTRDLRAALLVEPSLERHFERVRSCDMVVFGVGELTPQTRWADGDFLIRPCAEAYIQAGGAGILIGRFIDADGEELDGPLSGRQIGMELSSLRAAPIRLCVTGGVEKLAAIRAVLAGGYVTHLATDALTAGRLLEDGPEGGEWAGT